MKEAGFDIDNMAISDEQCPNIPARRPLALNTDTFIEYA
jgi:hypothetical protein